MKTILNTVEKTFKKDSRLWSEDKKPVLLKAKLIELLIKDDEELLSLLINEPEIEKRFFKKVRKVTIFQKDRFIQLVTMNEFLPSSFTAFENKIGLAKNGKLLSQNDDISLVFPHKDCILEGGQTKEEQKRDEIFYNTIFAPDEVDRLKEPKVFANAKRISANKKGEIVEEEIIEISETDNMIIKGNNLMALYSLLPKYRGKIKLIYIDPPYNTGSDSFGYNDNFNHSTWLTFMKNRLEVARELLKDDGVIFVQCDDNEQAYLKVLMDNVFGNNNFINLVTVKTKIGGVSGSSEGKSLKDATEFINIFAKNKEQIYFNPIYKTTPLFKYITSYKDEGKSWKYTSVITKLEGKKEIKKTDKYTLYSYEIFESKSVKEFAKINNISEEDVYIKYNDKIFRTTNAQSSVRKTVLSETENVNKPIVSIEYIPQKGKNKGSKVEVFYKDKQRNMIMFLSDMLIEIDNVVNYREKLNTLWDDVQYNNLSKEGNVDFPNGKKPEYLLKTIIDMSTDKNDIILDYHAGAGTTGAVAHKMNRQYILIEQMDYINDYTNGLY